MKIKWIRELFSFSRKERNGIIGLLIVIFLLIVIGKLIPLFVPSDKTDFSKWDAEVNTYLAKKGNMIPVENTLHPIAFNPNEVDSVSLVKMGLPPKVVANWLNYLKKGGRFRDKEGLKKIFGMTSLLFEQLDSFIVIPREKMAKVRGSANNSWNVKPNDGIKRDTIFRRTWSKRETKPVMMQELNSTDSLHLLDIPGIGPVFASRIIRYRNLLGGYYSVSQLKEVYGMREENFIAVSQYFTADQSTLKKLNINFLTFKELGRHPYVGFNAARKICKLRDKAGKFTSPDNLSPVVTGDSLKKLIPYMNFTR
jgi:competence protein ComEA